MRKRGQLFLLGFIFLIFMAGFALAVNDTNTSGNSGIVTDDSGDGASKAYQCLRDEINGKDSFSLEEAIFSSLAIGSNQKLKDIIENEENVGQNCWPNPSCNLKRTAQVLLALDRAGGDKRGAEKWILSKNQTATELDWFLEIDIQSHVESTCTLRYRGDEKEVDINEDLTISKNPGTCLSVTPSGYWLNIKDSCLDEEFEISCDEDFITTLLYQKGVSGTVFVSSETHSSSGLGTTKEKVNSQCFKAGSNCDYEGTLWAALALNKLGRDTDAYLPYLLAFSEDNQKYFPSSFLYTLTSGEDQFNELVQSQKQGRYWEIVGSPGNRFYDTALGMLGLAGTSATELENAKDYLLDIQTDKGCWNNNNIRDTAFLLYAGWARAVATSGTSNAGRAGCESSGNYCGSSFSCLESGGLILNNFECSNVAEICCSVNVQEQFCSEKGGVICGANQQCSGRTTPSLDGTCCLDSCQNVEVQSTCEVFGGICRTSCFSDETEVSDSCSGSGKICCQQQQAEEKKSRLGIWITILIILIVLALLAIAFRNRLRVWWFKRKGKIRTSGVGPRPPPSSPGEMSRRPVLRFGSPRQAGRATGGMDKEFEETMNKLRDMSK